MTDNFTPVLIIPLPCPSQIIVKLQFSLGVYVPYILKLFIRKFLIPEQRQMSERAVLWLEFPTVLRLFQEIGEV